MCLIFVAINDHLNNIDVMRMPRIVNIRIYEMVMYCFKEIFPYHAIHLQSANIMLENEKMHAYEEQAHTRFRPETARQRMIMQVSKNARRL